MQTSLAVVLYSI